jgi:hypothetical protein
MNPITETQARHIVRVFCFDYADTEPANLSWWEEERAVNDLTLRLSWYVGRPLTATHVQDVLTTIDELDSVDAGTHPDIEQNNALTVDNRDWLREVLNARLNNEISEVLTLAGWRPALRSAA